jgi:hypothetical protein
MSRKRQKDKLQTVKLRHSEWITLLRAAHLVQEHGKVLRAAVYGNDPHGPACWAMELCSIQEVADVVLDQIAGTKPSAKAQASPDADSTNA